MADCSVDQFAYIGKCGSSGVDITLCYRTIGDKSKPCLLLLSEMGMSGIALWHDSFIDQLASSQAFYIVLLDYRDCGKSTHFNKEFDMHNKKIHSCNDDDNDQSGVMKKEQHYYVAKECTNKNSLPYMQVEQKGKRKEAENTFAENTTREQVQKRNKETNTSKMLESVNFFTNSKCNEERCENDDHDESDDIINELFLSNDSTTIVKKVGSKKAKTKKFLLSLKTSTPSVQINGSPSPVPSTLSIYIQLLRAFHSPGKYFVECPYTLSDMAQDAWALLLTHLSVKEVHLVGFSFGGMVAQMMAVQHPDNVKSLTLFATHTSNLVKTQWPSYMEILRYVRLLPSEMSPLLSSYCSTSSSTSPRLSEEQYELQSSSHEHTRRLHNAKANNTNASTSVLFAHSHSTEKAQKLLELYTSILTRFMELICGDKERFPFDKAWTERLMRRTCERGIDFDGAFNHLAVLLNASSRDALLHSTFTSRNSDCSKTLTHDNNKNSKVSSSDNCSTLQHASTAHFTHLHSSRKTSLSGVNGDRRYYIPTVIVQGTHDTLTPLCNAQHLASVIDGSKLIVINGMGHTLTPALDVQLTNIIIENVARGCAVTCNNVKPLSSMNSFTSHL